MSGESLRFAWRDGEVSGARHAAAGERRATLVWAHGAGGTMNHPHVTGVAEGLAAEGIETIRFNFPYSGDGRKAPDKQEKLEACYWGVAKTVAESADRLFLGGGSMGGRIASHIVSDGLPSRGIGVPKLSAAPARKARTSSDRSPREDRRTDALHVGHA